MTASDDGAIETARQWLRYAEGDVPVAEHEMLRPAPVYHTVCFLCQNAAEKFIKGFLISRGWSLEKTHDLAQLLGWCADCEVDLALGIANHQQRREYCAIRGGMWCPESTTYAS